MYRPKRTRLLLRITIGNPTASRLPRVCRPAKDQLLRGREAVSSQQQAAQAPAYTRLIGDRLQEDRLGVDSVAYMWAQAIVADDMDTSSK